VTHELSLMADLVRKVESVAAQEGAAGVTSISVRLGALSHMSPEHFREHWQHAAVGTVAEGAEIAIEAGSDPGDPHADEILLQSVTVADR
jgi:hydrogenase nickel incorporation protein HypA/HybF